MKFKKETMIGLVISYAFAFIGGLLVFLCAWWFFHFETWTKRGIYIGLTLLAVYILIKLMPEKYR
ncbi:MAG: hypothetical protein E7H57_08045 [Pantoea sp.]|nr:hypothetical protein [Pantoea sp.]